MPGGNFRKNVRNNVFAAALRKLVHKPDVTREMVFSMINLSPNCFNKPSLRGNLFLDAIDTRPYVALTQVIDVSSVVEIRDSIDRVLSVPSTELREMVLDYQTAIDAVSRQRYQEFLVL